MSAFRCTENRYALAINALIAAAIVVAVATIALALPALAQQDGSGIHAGICRSGKCGVNVPRNANTAVPAPPPEPRVPPDWCAKKETDMKRQYQQLLATYANVEAQVKAAHPDDPYTSSSELDDLRAELKQLRDEWGALSGRCGFVGSLGGGVPAQPRAPGGDTPGAGSPTSDPGRSYPAILSWSINAASLIAVPPGTLAGKGFGTGVARDRVTRGQLETRLANLARPPILRDSLGVVPASASASGEIPQDDPPLARTALDAAAQLDRESAYVAAYETSLGRYRGAMAAHDTAAAVRQADAMVPLIDSAGAAADRAAERGAETQRQFVALAGEGRATADSVFALAPALRDELTAGGLSASDLADVERQLAATTPADVRAALVELRAQTAVDSAIQSGLESTDSAATWPMPADGPQLIAAAAVARAIHSSPLATESIQLAEGDVGTSATTPPAPTAPRYSRHHGGWLGWLEGSWPTPRLWWMLPVIATGALVGYARRLRRR